jgi:hypothetical protein
MRQRCGTKVNGEVDDYSGARERQVRRDAVA